MIACQQCREAKRKCLRSKPGHLASCTRCMRHGLACSRDHRPTASHNRTLVAQLPQSGTWKQSCEIDDFLSDEHAIAELVQHYFGKIHDRPHSIFHAPSLGKAIYQRTVSRALLLAICAMGAHLSMESSARALEPLLTAEAKRLLQADLEHVCLENIQTCILIANICAAHANPTSEFLFFRKYPAAGELPTPPC